MFRPRDHLRDKGDPHPGGNERLHRLDIAAFKDDMGLETGFFAKFQGDFAETLSFFQKDERFVFELLERDRSLRFGQRMMGRDSEPNFFLDQIRRSPDCFQEAAMSTK